MECGASAPLSQSLSSTQANRSVADSKCHFDETPSPNLSFRAERAGALSSRSLLRTCRLA